MNEGLFFQTYIDYLPLLMAKSEDGFLKKNPNTRNSALNKK